MFFKIHDKIYLLGTALTGSFLLLPLVIIKQNRVVEGTGLRVWEISSVLPIILFLLLFLCITLSTRKNTDTQASIKTLVSMIWFIIPWMITALISKRAILGLDIQTINIISPGAGMWGILGASYILFYAAILEHKKNISIYIIPVLTVIVLLAAVYLGFFNRLSLIMEFMARQLEFIRELKTHFRLTLITTVTASVLGIAFGIISCKSKRTGSIIFFLTNSIQAIPSLALFSILILPLAILTSKFPILREFGIKGIGTTPALIALILYALLPIIRNTYAGLEAVDQAVREAGIGMGMGKYRLLFSVELPIAIPIIVRGIRTATVQAIGIITVAALINAGGMGLFIFQGMSQAAPDLVVMGVVPIVSMAIIVDKGMMVLEHVLTPYGRKREVS